MKVQSIDNKYHSPNFNAKIIVSGNIHDLRLKMISNWMDKAVKIGCDSDLIILQFGKKESSYAKRFLGFIPLGDKKVNSRKIFALSQINDKSLDENLSYYYKDKNFDEHGYINEVVDKYLDTLSKVK